jgi:hypothetical protein
LLSGTAPHPVHADPPAAPATATPATAAPATAAPAASAESSAAAVVPPPQLQVQSNPYRPTPGQTAIVTYSLKSPDGKQDLPAPTTLRIYIVRDDDGDLYFEQPDADSGANTFTESFTFPSGGDWRIFGEAVADDGTTRMTAPTRISVDGARPVRTPLIPQVLPLVHVGGYTLTFKEPTRVVEGDDARLVFALVDAGGNPVTDTNLWHDAIAHLILVDRDGKTLVHATPDMDDPRSGRSEYLIFPIHVPKEGIWRGWVVFERGSVPTTIPFVLRVLGR